MQSRPLDSRFPLISPTRTEATTRPTNFEPSPEEAKELDSWSERLRPEMGRLQTPPIGPQGSLEQPCVQAKAYVENLLDRLVGEELKQRKIQLRVEVFSGDIPQAALDDSEYLENCWREDHPGQVWPLRTWYGIERNGRPWYRLGLSLGMLSNLKTQEELAFVLAQQAEKLLAHDAEDPLNHRLLEPSRQNFLEPRQVEGGADKMAIDRMAKAGFNPKGAYDALTRLYAKFGPEYPRKDLDRGALAASHGQEHEGLRVALAQTAVEQLKRSGHPSCNKPLTPLPATLTIESAPLYETDVADFATFQKSFQDLALELAQNPPPSFYYGVGEAPASLKYLWAHRGSSQDYQKALLGACEALQSSNLSGGAKVDGFLRLLQTADCQRDMSEDVRQQIESFLKANLGQWDCAQFGAHLASGDKFKQRHFVEQVVLKETFQSFWPAAEGGNLLDSAPLWYCSDPDNGKTDLLALADLLKENHKEKPSRWRLSGAIDRSILKTVSQLQPEKLAQQSGRHGLPLGLLLSNDLLDVADVPAPMLLELDQTLDPIQKASASCRDQQMRLRLQPPYLDSPDLNGFLRDAFRSEEWAGFGPELDQQLSPLLLDLVRTSSGQADFVFDQARPQQAEPGLQRRLAALANSGERPAVLRHIFRNWVHEKRVGSTDPVREWTEPLAASISKEELLAAPDLSQHANLLRRTYLDGYQLDESALPDVSTPSLQALNERRENKEFEPKSEDYANDAEYWKAVDAYFARCDEMEKAVKFLAPAESRLVLGKLALVGHHPKVSQQLASQLNLSEFEGLLQQAEEAEKRSQLEMELTERGGNERIGVDVSGFLLDGFLAVQDQVASLPQWLDLCDRSLDFGNGSLQSRVGARKKLGNRLNELMQPLEPEEVRKWMRRRRPLEVLAPQQASLLLMRCAASDDPKELARQVAALDHDYRLQDSYPMVYRQLRDDLTVRAKLQPDTVDVVFPPENGGAIEEIGPFRTKIRGLSGLLAMSRQRPIQEQLDTIEYLMGRHPQMPAYLEEASESQDYAPLAESLQTAREDLSDADSNTRVLVANSFLAGPSGILRSEAGQQAVMQHFLRGISPENLDLARKIATAVLHSQGDADTLAVAYILGQKPKDGQEKMDEAAILNRLFDAYGVPGIKMKQYLAFTSEFSKYKEAFESSQDAALPLSQFQVLKLIQKRFGDQWPADLKIDKVLGSGSVNVAIRYTDQSTGRREVVSLGREDIQEQTQYDFERFHRFIDELTANPEDKQRFGYILGLLDIIHASVALEFDKEAVLDVQKQAFESYRHQFPDWTVRSIDAYKVENLGLFMQEAKGKTARKIGEKSPQTYKSAMSKMNKVEMGILRGQDSEGNLLPKPLFANPDFHDGQVLIDEANKTVTILDFGQAVPIDNAQRKTALDLLTIIGKGDSPQKAAKRLNRRFFDKQPILTAKDLEPLLAREQRMDIFVHLLSLLNRQGAKVPISAVHWILGLNRQIALSERLGQPVHSQVRHMVINHKLGLPLGLYNIAHQAKEKAMQWGAALSGCLGLSWATGEATKPSPEDNSGQPQQSWAWNPAEEFRADLGRGSRVEPAPIVGESQNSALRL